MSIQSSDKLVSSNIMVAYASYYGKRKAHVKLLVQLVQDALPVLKKVLSVPEDVTVRIGGIKGRVNGRYFSGDRCACIDDSLPIRKALEVLAHELVHAEQYHTGRLSYNYVSGKGYVANWSGEAVHNKGTTYRAYRAQPWEQEAWDRQAKLAAVVASVLGRDDLMPLNTSTN